MFLFFSFLFFFFIFLYFYLIFFCWFVGWSVGRLVGWFYRALDSIRHFYIAVYIERQLPLTWNVVARASRVRLCEWECDRHFKSSWQLELNHWESSQVVDAGPQVWRQVQVWINRVWKYWCAVSMQFLCGRDRRRPFLPSLSRHHLPRFETRQHHARPGGTHQNRRFRHVQNGHQRQQDDQDLLWHSRLHRPRGLIPPTLFSEIDDSHLFMAFYAPTLSTLSSRFIPFTASLYKTLRSLQIPSNPNLDW